MIKSFICGWMIYWIIYCMLPARSMYEGVGNAFFLQISFVILVLFGFYSFKLLTPLNRLPDWRILYNKNNANLIKFCIILSFMGTIFLIYDKVFIQNIDYTEGLAAAREQWRQEGLDRGGSISSIYSIIGYLFNSGYFVAVVLFFIYGQYIGLKDRVMIMLSIFILLMANSLLTGGRTNVLLMFVILYCTIFSVRNFSAKKLFGERFLFVIGFMFCVSIFYIMYVFASRADISEMTPMEYVRHFSPHLGLEVYDSFFDFKAPSQVLNMLALMFLCLAYITHSLATTAALVSHGQGEEIVLFVHFSNILYKLGLIDLPNMNWLLSGRFPSLPGAIYYQLGVFGFVVISIFLGFLSSLSLYLYNLKSNSLVAMFFQITMFSILVCSPLLLVLDLMSYPFMILFVLLLSGFKTIIIFLKER